MDCKYIKADTVLPYSSALNQSLRRWILPKKEISNNKFQIYESRNEFFNQSYEI